MPTKLKDSLKILANGKFIRLISDGGWEFAQRNNCTGIVVVLAMTQERKVILTRQYRRPVDCDVIEFPAGLVNDKGQTRPESISVAAKRELLEETGYHASKMTKIMTGPVSAGFSSDLLTLYLAEGLTKKHSGGGDDTENIAVHAVPLAKVPAWLKSMEKKGCLVDPKVYAGLYFLNNVADIRLSGYPAIRANA